MSPIGWIVVGVISGLSAKVECCVLASAASLTLHGLKLTSLYSEAKRSHMIRFLEKYAVDTDKAQLSMVLRLATSQLGKHPIDD